MVNETRFQFQRDINHQLPLGTGPTIDVQQSFTFGQNSEGLVRTTEDNYELQNYTSLTAHNHLIKFGGRLRRINAEQSTNANFNGEFIFSSVDPNDPLSALEAYQKGKEYFYTRRGQLNFSCATCHVQAPGERIRAEILAPALGILNAMPIYRSEWSGMGTISRRFTTCNSQIRGVPLSPQDEEYRDLEYYLSYVSNGLPISGPGARP